MTHPEALSKRAIRSTELLDALKETLNRVEYGRERIYVIRHGEPSALLVPCTEEDLAEFRQLVAESAA